jgi:ferric iron reductase protein FhuF
MRRWNTALHYILEQLKQQHGLTMTLPDEYRFTEIEASKHFERSLQRAYQKLGEKRIVFIFDEIENITFGISPSPHWSDGLDFVYFWQTLRSLFQRSEQLFSFMIVGTNAMCVESPTVNGKDNPIFNQVPFTYIDRFDVPETRDMVRKLGRAMGLRFDEIIYGKLTEDW